jgi:hypothetical protein
MMMKYCEDHTILDMIFLDPTMVTKALVTKKPDETDNYIVDFFPGTLEKAIHIPTLHLQVYI